MKKLPSLVCALALVLGPAAPAVAQTSDHEVPLAGAATVRINVSGSIHVTFDSAATSVKIHSIDRGPSSPPLKVASGKAGSRLTITITGPAASMLPFNGESGYETQVTVPAGASLDLREFSGHVQIDRIASPTQVYDAEGTIDVGQAAAPLTAEADAGDITVAGADSTLNLTAGTGNIVARLNAGWHGQQVRLETTKGNMKLTAPPDLRASFDLTSAGGTVTNPLHSTPHAPSVFMLAEQGNIAIATATPSP
jgi:hypothetical protein